MATANTGAQVPVGGGNFALLFSIPGYPTATTISGSPLLVIDKIESEKITGHPLKNAVEFDLSMYIDNADWETILGSYIDSRDFTPVKLEYVDSSYDTQSLAPAAKTMGLIYFMAPQGGKRKTYVGTYVFSGATGDKQEGKGAGVKVTCKLNAVPLLANLSFASSLFTTPDNTGAAKVTAPAAAIALVATTATNVYGLCTQLTSV